MEAFVTLVTSETYVVGAMVLGYSLAQTGTSKRLICMVTAGLSSDSVASLRELYEVRAVAPLDSRDHRSLQLLGRPELGPTFTKIQLWALTDLHKAVFLDADMLVLRNMDDLFEREELSACADVGWPDCFNSGLFVCRPSAETHARLLALASAEGSFDGGDQGLLNAFFASWATGPSERRIPFVYNVTCNACYSYLPAFERFRGEIRAVHFIGNTKPWSLARLPDGTLTLHGSALGGQAELLQQWWALHDALLSTRAQGASPPYFMSLYPGSGYAPYPGAHGHSGAGRDEPALDCTTAADFANYRIKWTADVERFFQKKVSKTPSRKLIQISEDCEECPAHVPAPRAPAAPSKLPATLPATK